jgi:CBS domain containing-hemolysin-like protein
MPVVMGDKDTVIGVRLPSRIRDLLQRKAREQNRTMSSQALVYIQKGLEAEP